MVAEGDGAWVEYAGGYSDMLAQRGGSAPAERQVSSEKIESPKAAVKSDRKAQKLSYKDQRVLDLLPQQMAKLEKAIIAYREILSDPGLYARDAGKFQKVSDDLEKAEAELVSSEEQWLELEAKKEALEAQ